ncbi:MAG: ferrochelatase [Gammaproteobacteria bacterium]|nr:ferrochelatase [Gammaproteobacteria bacterium]
MKYKNQSNQLAQTDDRLGILLVNLGTPDEPTTDAVRRYLAEFLSDPRVVAIPRILWMLILHGIVLRIRPKRSAEAYRSVWTTEGSPLLAISQKQHAAIDSALQEQLNGRVKVTLAMRYGNPSINAGLEELRLANVQRLLVVPLYPQYSATTTASIFDAVTHELQGWRWLPELRFINRYHDDPAYIQALAESIRDHRQANGVSDKLLFSFHGIPKDYFEQGDPYPNECRQTAQDTIEQLGLGETSWAISFQSRFGKQEWVKPYTDETLKDWGKHGIDSVQVVCPAFAADCLETLEEIAVENRDYFLEAGGKNYQYIPALNDRETHIRMLTQLIIRHCQGWPEAAGLVSE